MTMPTSGIIGSLRVVVLLNIMLVHLGTVCFYKDAPAITALPTGGDNEPGYDC